MTNWNYEHESEDFITYRKYEQSEQSGKKASDKEVRKKLETLHEWFPNETLAQLKQKEDIIQKHFIINIQMQI